MAKPKLKQHHINRDWCKGCGICVELCPKKVLELDEQDKVRAARPEDCICCKLCELRCPDFAIEIETQEAVVRIIDKTGPLYNPADRDHCIQYMTAIGLIFGELTAAHYEDGVAADARIDALREKMICVEDQQYSRDYLDPEKRSIANAVQVFFKDGSSTQKVEVQYPIGHRRRRSEAVPLLFEKFQKNLGAVFTSKQAGRILERFRDPQVLDATPAHELVDLFTL